MSMPGEKILNKIKWQRVPVDDMKIIEPKKEAKTAGIYAVFFVLVSIATGLIIKNFPLPILGAASLTDDFWYVFVFKFIFLLLIPVYWYYKKGYRLSDLMPGWKPDARHIRTLFICLIIGLSVNLLQGRLGMVREAAAGFSTGGLTARLGLGIFIPLMQAGFPEEFCFRGILQTRLEKVWGRFAGITISVLLFAAWHIPTRYFLSQGVEGTAGDLMSVITGTGIPVFIVGLIFALFWDRYRSLLPLIAAHWGVDIIPSIISYLGVSY
ncbi:MAG: CPBP family intramembrane metalloprotease [bacterium]|nr:CPBP family intramembrane metalloprotease [bacterium]